ncbi:hypothetical protein PV08_00604 [Exophiala spinifera]|uniref:C4-dicarboxylate transporter/malic acid transporter n=1 Tax=Exophiala spinifera TaxID=91928 RepID=A0A0D2C924_9EURO|nr:uncharacterized protein PV08_00604 [Exophiala spinifera]KIW20029.1 hypothetical protein PV08_00604 [Exophiala spinifera]
MPPGCRTTLPPGVHGYVMQRNRTGGLHHRPGDEDGCLDISARPSQGHEGWRTPTLEDTDLPPIPSESITDYSQYGAIAHRENMARPGVDDIDTDNDPDRKQGSHDHDDEAEKPKDLSWKQRMQHATWAWFTLTMATGGIANVLHDVPYRFKGLYTIGLIFFLLNIVFYLVIWAMIITRFVLYPWTFKASLTHPTESLFVPAFAVSFGTILINIVEYGAGEVGAWLHRTVVVLFWIDCGVAIGLSIAIYLILWSTLTFTIARMTPVWIFPAYPLLIMGPHAANLSDKLGGAMSQAIRIIIAGFTIQGIGFLVSLTIYSAFVYRLMTQKLPAEPLRPGMFVSVGPSAFTVSGTIGMAQNLQKVIASSPTYEFMDVPGLLAARILRLCANWMSLWLWGLAWWFFFISLLSNAQCIRTDHRMPFSMTWFSFIFPQTALTTATFAIAEAFNVNAIRVIGCVMTVILILAWAVVVACMIRAIVNKQILWPEKGEDKTEGGFKPIQRTKTNQSRQEAGSQA